MKDIASAQAFFAGDIFAVETVGLSIEEARPDYARCALDAGTRHLNAHNTVMGGALFTLADFAFAVAANSEDVGAVSVSCDITYHNAACPGRLTAETQCLKSGRRVCSFLVTITDEAGACVATTVSTGIRTPRAEDTTGCPRSPSIKIQLDLKGKKL
ncbi:MAG: PaaI family thioesterase [Oscillospiraceae bacterium]|nr:PaaI family thioesterase [Oscillospiraceae bacterium]